MKLYAVYLNFVDNLVGEWNERHCVCLSTDKALMEHLGGKYLKRTNKSCFPQHIYTFETLDWDDLQEQFNLTPQQIQYLLNRLEDKLVVTEYELKDYDFNLAKFIANYTD